MANALRGKGRPHKLSEFQLRWDRPSQTWQEQLAFVQALTVRMGGEIGHVDDRPPGH
ncbi:MAG: hypothetical protein L0Y54_00615 [Sporichthyaceae bacterium]|nr:hypothetical protein [Sporichthyaceae bacterium]